MLDKAAKAVVGKYGMLVKGNQICAFAMFSDDGKHYKPVQTWVCHAPLSGWQKEASPYDQLVTSFPAKSNRDYRFFCFLKEHLFKNWRDHIHLEFYDDKPYLRVSGLDSVPANVVYNLCICSRMIIEFRRHVKRWDRLTRLGFNPGFAFAVCTSNADWHDLEKPVTDAFYAEGGNTWHSPFDITVDISRMMNGDPTNLSVSYKTDKSKCTPCNSQWGFTTHLKGLVGKTLPEFYKTFQQPENETA